MEQNLNELEREAQIESLLNRIEIWSQQISSWRPLKQQQNFVSQVLKRAQNMYAQLNTPLVAATLGGTGTGKSTLVNALVGQECTKASREQRPTTQQPILIAHPQTELELTNLPLNELEIKRIETPFLENLILVDCPDPDTDETSQTGTNRALMQLIAPYCDVLFYTSTQQKYRSARVNEEFARLALGSRHIFIQTHAVDDEDIRTDWQAQFAESPPEKDFYFVDAVQAFKEQQTNQPATGEWQRLLSFIKTDLGKNKRVEIRTRNISSLMHSACSRAQVELANAMPSLVELEKSLEQHQQRFHQSMSEKLIDELQECRQLWEQRLLQSLTDRWGTTPFSLLLRFYCGLGGWLASIGLLRARTTAHVAIIGAIQGARWLESLRARQQAESQFEQAVALPVDDALLREARLIVSGHLKSSQFDLEEDSSIDWETLRKQAHSLQESFLQEASGQIDVIVESLAKKNSGFVQRTTYDAILSVYLLLVLIRISGSFFATLFFLSNPNPLGMDFYLPALIILILLCGGLIGALTLQLRNGLKQEVRILAEGLIQHRLATGLFPGIEQMCTQAKKQTTELQTLLEQAATLMNQCR